MNTADIGEQADMSSPAELEGFVISPQQRRSWLFRRHVSALYVQITVEIQGSLDVPALKRAVEDVVDTNEILRTTFRRVPGSTVPVQVVSNKLAPDWREMDLAGLDSESQSDRVHVFLNEWVAAPFSYDHGSLFRVGLLRTDAERHLLSLCLPSVCADSASMGILVRQIAARISGSDFIRGDEPLQYADLSGWQNQLLAANTDLDPGQAFWRKQNLDVPEMVLPNEICSQEERTFRSVSISTLLDAAVLERLTRTASSAEVLPSSILAGRWLALLSSLSRTNDVLIQHIASGRPDEDLQNAIGPLERGLPVRLFIDSNHPADRLWRRTNEAILDATRWEHYWDWRGTEAECGPTKSIFFRFEEDPGPLHAGGLDLVTRDRYSCLEPFKLQLSCIRKSEGLYLEFSYDAERYLATDIRRLCSYFCVLLQNALDRPNVPIGSLTLLPGDELNQLLFTWNDTERVFPVLSAVHHLFEQWVCVTPDAPALVFEDQKLSYAQLNVRANQLAHHLISRGVGPDVPVGLCVERSLEMIVGLIGILKAGGAYVPLDPALPSERLDYMLADSGAKLLVSKQELPLASSSGVQAVLLDRDGDMIARESEANPDIPVRAEHLVYIIYTSGSTGQPKGVCIEHRNLLNYVQGVSERLSLLPGASFATVSTIAADLGNTALFPALCNGGCLHVISQERSMDTALWREYFEAHTVDCLKIVPSHLAVLIEGSDSSASMLPRQVLVMGGEASNWDLVKRISELSPSLRILNHYGPTETTVGVLTYGLSADQDGAELKSTTVPLGRPLPNSRVYLLNEYLQPVPVGTVGEVYIGGAGVGRGYLNRPELTAERFVRDPFSTDEDARLYRTGDLARMLLDGNIEFLGRADDQVKISGYRIELGEIESVLVRHTGVREAVILAREDIPGEKRLVGYVVFKGEALSSAELREHLRQRLPEYMVPAVFVAIKRMPLTLNGKVDRKALPAPQEAEELHAFVAPRNETEEMLAGIWRTLLRREQVSVNDNFFELGGHSLLAVKLVSEIRRLFGQKLPLQMLFQSATIESIARELSPEFKTTCWANVNTVTPAKPGADRVPMFCMAGARANALGYVALGRHLAGDQPLFVLQSNYRSNDDRPYTQQELHDLAAVHIRALRDLQPNGPYCLGGMCEGAHIAFEMARQLQMEHKEVPLLVSFDAWPEQNTRSQSGWWIEQVSRALVRRRKDSSVRMLWVARQIARVTVKSLRRCVTLTFQVQDPDSWEARYWPGRSFVPPKFDGVMTVFRVAKQDLHRPRRRDLCWTDWTTQGVEIYDVPGEHHTMLREQHVEKVAATLDEHLKRVQQSMSQAPDDTVDRAIVVDAEHGEPLSEHYAAAK